MIIHSEIKPALLKSALSTAYPDHPLLFHRTTLVGQYNLRPLGPAAGMMYVFPGMSGRSLEFISYFNFKLGIDTKGNI